MQYAEIKSTYAGKWVVLKNLVMGAAAEIQSGDVVGSFDNREAATTVLAAESVAIYMDYIGTGEICDKILEEE